MVFNPFAGNGGMDSHMGTGAGKPDTEFDDEPISNLSLDEEEDIEMPDSDMDFTSDSSEYSNDGGGNIGSGQGGGTDDIFQELEDAHIEAGEDLEEEGESDGIGTDSSSADSSSSEGTETGMTDEFSDHTAKWLVDVYAQTFCMFMRNYAKIDKKTVYEAILAGYLDERFLDLIEDENAKVDSRIKMTDEQKKFIISPMKNFVQVNKIKVPTGLQIIIGLGVVSGTIFMSANDLRKSNEFLLQKIMQESQRIREEDSRKKGDSINYTADPTKQSA